MQDWLFVLGETFLYTSLTFIVGLFMMPQFIKLLRKYKIGKNIREESLDGKKTALFSALHAKKSGTPTMGGVAIWGLVLAVVFFSRTLSFSGIIDHSLLQRSEVYLPLFTLLFVGILGAVDDYFNVKGIGKTKGLSFTVRSSILLFFGLLGGLWFYLKLDYTHITIPFFGLFEMGWLYVPFFIFVVFFTSNAVNVADGLDGLAGGLLLMSFAVLGILSVFREHIFLGLFCGVIVGAILAFLWYNVPPAQFYMGDTGAFALGACLAVIALMTDLVFVLPFIGFVFFMTMLSVVLQLFWKKFLKKKLFLIAPIHHHFEQKGWSESAIVMRFWIVGSVFCLLGLFVGVLVLEQQKVENIYQNSEILDDSKIVKFI